MKINKPKRLKLRKWTDLEGIRKRIREHAKYGIFLPCADLIYEYIRLCGVRGNFSKKPWFKTIATYNECQLENLPRVKFPILTPSDGKDETIPWDYVGRDWYWWVNILAKNYGWNQTQIAELDIDDAIGLYQEITVDDQLEKEFFHDHSELAWEYVPATKKSKLVPLPRPKWMKVTKENYKPKPVKKTKIPVRMMPVGEIVNLDEEDAPKLHLDKEEQDANTSPTTP